jgi:hypothetical protein
MDPNQVKGLRPRHAMSAVAALTLVGFFCALSGSAHAQQFKFGILKMTRDGGYEIDVETTRIPQRLQSTGFRFGVAFDNPTGKEIEWYELMHLPMPLQQLSGGLREIDPKVLRTDTQRSAATHIVDQFWFDLGDPLGSHRLELFIDGVKQFEVNFEVVESP